MSKSTKILEQAKRLAEQFETWADLSNALFDPLTGLVVRTFPDRRGRTAFRKTDEYEALHDLVQEKMSQTGLVEGAEPLANRPFNNNSHVENQL